MAQCKYAQLADCKNTNCLIQYKSCPLFRKQHALTITRDIRPFKYNSKHITDEQVCFSRDENKIKSMAFNKALKENSVIKKFSASQCLHVMLWETNMDLHSLNTKVVFVDYSSTIYNDDSNILKSIGNFCSAVAMDGVSVFIYVKKGLKFLSEIKEV